MAAVKVYGHSDDCVMATGDVPGCGQFDVPNDNSPTFVHFSTGDVLRVEYTEDGVWTVSPHEGCMVGRWAKEPHGDGDDPDPYTETVTAVGNFAWVRFCPAWPMTPADVRKVVGDYLEIHGTVGIPDAVIAAIYEAIPPAKGVS